MLDALLYAVRDGIRRAGMNYGIAECDISDDGKPPPRCGNVFVSIHSGSSKSTADNQLYELYNFAVTLTMRVTVPLDQVGTAQIARNLAIVPLGQRQGFNHKLEQLRSLIHMNWAMVVLQGQTPNSANDNLAAWATGTVYGFCEPQRYRGRENPTLVGGEWFSSEPDVEDMGIKAEIQFEGAKRIQAQLASVGPFV